MSLGYTIQMQRVDHEFYVDWLDNEGTLFKRIYNDGLTNYYDKNGHLHRQDGPARRVLGLHGIVLIEEYWYHGKLIKCETRREFERLIRLKAFW
jgi:hypothetical protein